MILYKKVRKGVMDQYCYSIFIVVLLMIIYTCLRFLRSSPKNLIMSVSKLPPRPKSLPFLGNILQLGPNPHRSLTKFSKIYGPLMSLKLGSLTTIVVSSPQIAKEMFLKHDLAFSHRNVPEFIRSTAYYETSIVFLPVSPKWRQLRKILAVNLLNNQRLNSAQGLRQSKVDELVEFARECCSKGQAIDIGKAGFITSLNLLSNTLFSFNLASHASSTSQEFKNEMMNLMEEVAKPSVSDFFPLFKLLDFAGARRTERVRGYVEKLGRMMDEIVNERLGDPSVVNSSSFGEDMLGTLLMLVKENELDVYDVKHMLLELFAGGTDTTSSTLEWAMTELLRDPEKMSKAQSEIDQVIGKSRQVQESDVSSLPYLQAVVKETLRLHAPAPFLIPHKAEKDVELCGYLVPKNAQVWVNVWSIGRDPSVWEDPESFSPERFLKRDIDFRGHDFELIPFGAGRRICPGLPLAYRMVHLMLATLLHSFTWKLGNGLKPQEINMEERFGLTLQKLHPLQAVPMSKCED